MNIRKTIKRTLAGLLLMGGIAFASAGCKHKSKSFFPGTGTGTGTGTANHPPVIQQPADDTSIENQLYTKIINMSDEDGDELTPYFVQAPEGANLAKTSPTTAEVSWIPSDNQSDIPNTFTLEVSDNNSATDQVTWTSNTKNVSDVTYRVLECGSGAPIQGATVFLGTDNQTTGSLGYTTFTGKQSGSYPVTIKDTSTQYVTFKPGTLIVSKQKQDENKLNLEAKLLPENYFNFMNPTVRLSDEICKFQDNANIIFDIYTTEAYNGIQVAQSEIDEVEDVILNNLSNRWGYEFTNSNIKQYDSLPPFVQPPDNHITIYWDNFYGGGWNHPYLQGNTILSAVTRCNTNVGKAAWLNEFANLFTNSDDSNEYLSVRNDPSTEIDFRNADDIVDDYFNNRKKGNKNLYDSNPDDRDVNPDSSIVNP